MEVVEQFDIETVNKMENIELKYNKTDKYNCCPSTMSGIGITATVLYFFVYEDDDTLQFMFLLSVIVSTWFGVIAAMIAIYNGATACCQFT